MLFQQSDKDIIHQWYDQVKSKSAIKNQSTSHIKSERESFVEESSQTEKVREILKTVYDSGYGFKLIGKDLDFTYPVIRKIIIDYLKIDHRKGTNVVTDKLRKIRSENLKGEKSPWYNWPEKYPHLLDSNCHTGIQGYYKRKNGKFVWLRSCWEYIYAKWLDTKNIHWDVEVRAYKLPDGRTYRPDFFIYDDDSIVSIIEIKGQTFLDRKKSGILNEILTDVDVVQIDNIKPFIEKNSTYSKELQKWKQVKLSKEELEKLK